MNHLIGVDELSRTLSVPVCLPQTELMRNDCLVLQALQLPPHHLLRFRWLTLHLTSQTAGTPELANSGLGLCYVGLFGPIFNVAGFTPTGTPLAYLSTSVGGAVALNPHDFTDVSAPGTYLIAVVNNTTAVDLSLCVSGLARLYCQTHD